MQAFWVGQSVHHCKCGKIVRFINKSIFCRKLAGSLPADLGRLTEVSEVDFSCNQVKGEILFFCEVVWLQEEGGKLA